MDMTDIFHFAADEVAFFVEATIIVDMDFALFKAAGTGAGVGVDMTFSEAADKLGMLNIAAF